MEESNGEISTDFLRERLKSLRSYSETFPNEIYRFARYLALRLNGPSLTPSRLIEITNEAIEDLHNGVDRRSRKPINMGLTFFSDYFYSFFRIELPSILKVIGKDAFSRQVKEIYYLEEKKRTEMEKEARKKLSNKSPYNKKN